MHKCHVCGKHVPVDRSAERGDGVEKRELCVSCFNTLNGRDGYTPKVYKRSDMAVCESCGEVSASVMLTGDGWFCEDCA